MIEDGYLPTVLHSFEICNVEHKASDASDGRGEKVVLALSHRLIVEFLLFLQELINDGFEFSVEEFNVSPHMCESSPNFALMNSEEE